MACYRASGAVFTGVGMQHEGKEAVARIQEELGPFSRRPPIIVRTLANSSGVWHKAQGIGLNRIELPN